MVIQSPPFLGWFKMAVGLLRVTPGTPLTQTMLLLCCPLNNCKRTACSLFEICHMSSIIFCLSLARVCLLILLLLLMSGNIHPNPGFNFPCSLCTGNVTWWDRSVQCYTCSKWVHLKCSLLSSRFRTLGSSHSWSWPPAAFLLLLETTL